MASSCHPSVNTEDDSVILFSASSSSEEYSSGSLSSSYSHQSPRSLQPSIHDSINPSNCTLSVKNLSYTINSSPTSFFNFFEKPKPITILKSLSFVAKSSEILAIVGPSGTGKSTLLKIISGRVKEQEFLFDPNGGIFINETRVFSPTQLRKTCGFVPQEDDLLPLLTVKETLMYSANFRLKNTSFKEKEEKVEKLMHELGLVHVSDSFVGDDENRGISGGERKRVSIAVDLIHDPSMLLLDEPTSGLDSSSALQVIQILDSIAKSKKRTVVLSIHQPSYTIIQYISKVLILSHGYAVHNGTLDSLEETMTRMGFQIPVQLNPIEFAMEIIDSLESSNSNDSKAEYDFRGQQQPNDCYSNKQSNRTFCFLDFLEIMILCSRFWRIIYRTKQLFLARTMQALVGGFGLASVYVKVGRDQLGVNERLGLFAFSLSFLLSSTVEALPIYLQERRVLMKESSRGAYKISSYMISNTITFLPFLFVVSVLFSLPVYWIVGLNPSVSAFAFFLGIVWLIVMMASSLVLFLSAISPDFISGNSLICTVLGGFFLFSGYFIPKENIPKYWIFMYYVSLYRYPLDCLLTNEYWSVREDCFSWGTQDDGSAKCLITGNDVLKSRGLDSDTRWINVGIMLGFFVWYRVLCWIVLSRKASRTTI